jgi:hypothetical protein
LGASLGIIITAGAVGEEASAALLPQRQRSIKIVTLKNAKGRQQDSLSPRFLIHLYANV